MSTDQDSDNFIHEDTGRRNLTALKKQQEEIHSKLEQIIALKRDDRLALPIDHEGHVLLTRIAGMKAGDPRSREMRYAAKCYMEWDTDAIEKILAEHSNKHERLLDLETPINQWHNTLLDTPAELTAFMQTYPAAQQDAQRLRQLVRNAAKEQKAKIAAQAEGKKQGISQKSTQALLQAIREIVRA